MLAAVSEGVEELFREHYEFLYTAAYGVTGNRHDADTVLLSLFVRLQQNGLSSEQRRNPAHCLHRGVMTLSLNLVRASSHQPRVRGFKERDAFHVPLMTAIARLKPRAFEIVLLHYKHDYSNAQIAELLGTSHGTIAVTLTRMRAGLRKVLHSAGCDQEGVSREALRELIDRHVLLPSQLEMTLSRDWILERLRSTAAPPERIEKGGAAVSWLRSRFERCL